VEPEAVEFYGIFTKKEIATWLFPEIYSINFFLTYNASSLFHSKLIFIFLPNLNPPFECKSLKVTMKNRFADRMLKSADKSVKFADSLYFYYFKPLKSAEI
jgi:hypothetical protein